MSEVSCKDRFDFMNQDELKQAVARAAIDHLVYGAVVGVGSGSTVALFIRELGQIRNRFKGAVSSSELSTRLLREEGIDVLPLEAVGSIPVYVDGADEIDPGLRMIKGGGGHSPAKRSSRPSRSASSASSTDPRWCRYWAVFLCRSRSFRWPVAS
jgi:hypothetical protein